MVLSSDESMRIMYTSWNVWWDVPSCNRTWQWTTPLQKEVPMQKQIYTLIFHCRVWWPEGKENGHIFNHFGCPHDMWTTIWGMTSWITRVLLHHPESTCSSRSSLSGKLSNHKSTEHNSRTWWSIIIGSGFHEISWDFIGNPVVNHGESMTIMDT